MDDEFTATDLIDRAINYIKSYGWTQGDWKSEQGSVCLVGAIRMAAGSAAPEDMQVPAERAEAYFLALDAVMRACGDDYVTDWNDTPDRTEDEVLAVLDQARTLVTAE